MCSHRVGTYQRCHCLRALCQYWELNLFIMLALIANLPHSTDPLIGFPSPLKATPLLSTPLLFAALAKKKKNQKVKYFAFCDCSVCVCAPLSVCVHVTARISADVFASAHRLRWLCVCVGVCLCVLSTCICICITLGHDSRLRWLVAASLHHQSERSLNLYSDF